MCLNAQLQLEEQCTHRETQDSVISSEFTFSLLVVHLVALAHYNKINSITKVSL